MHNSIYEVSRSPVPASQRARAGNMPDWFFERVCDYAENPTPRQREEALGVLFKTLGRFCTKEGEKFSLSPQIKEEFFRNRYECFRAAAEALAQTNYAIFAGIRAAPAFQLALDGLRDSYEDQRGIYIYSPETDSLVTLEHWLRSADLSRPFYIGGTIDYHCESGFQPTINYIL